MIMTIKQRHQLQKKYIVRLLRDKDDNSDYSSKIVKFQKVGNTLWMIRRFYFKYEYHMFGKDFCKETVDILQCTEFKFNNRLNLWQYHTYLEGEFITNLSCPPDYIGRTFAVNPDWRAKVLLNQYYKQQEQLLKRIDRLKKQVFQLKKTQGMLQQA